MRPNRDTVLQIDLGALAHNFAYLKSRLLPETRFLGVVKAFAYGSEAVAVARKLESLGADYLGVAFTDEGIHLRENGIGLPILVLHPQPSGLTELLAHRLEPNLYSRKIFEAFQEVAKYHGQRACPVHLKFNTGLNRLGFTGGDLPWLGEQLQNNSTLEVRSLFSHLAASDDLGERAFTEMQILRFRELVAQSEKYLPGKPLRHLLNTSGILNYAPAQWDMVRSGIGLYGYSNDPVIDKLLRPVVSLKTHISQMHSVLPGDWVGYNKGFQATLPMTTATLPIGHADGIGRQYGRGRGRVFIGGKAAPIIGNVCMDMTLIDVTGLGCREGDEVLFFGPGYSAEAFAAGAGTISYELLAGISQRVSREIIDPGTEQAG